MDLPYQYNTWLLVAYILEEGGLPDACEEIKSVGYKIEQS